MTKETYLATKTKPFFSPDTPAHIIHKYRHLQRIDQRKTRDEQKVDMVICDIRRVASNLNIPKDVQDYAINLFLKCVRQLKPPSLYYHYFYACASLIIASRTHGRKAPVTLQEILNEFNRLGVKITIKRVFRTLREISEKLKIKPRIKDPKDYLLRIIDETFNLDEVKNKLNRRGVDAQLYKQKVIIEAIKLLNKTKKETKGRRPITVALATIYGAEKIVAYKLGIRPVITMNNLSTIIGSHGAQFRACYAKVFKKYVIKETKEEFYRNYVNKNT
mgnify:CR=1 FL=1